MARIELRNIVMTYGSHHAVQNLDLTIEDRDQLIATVRQAVAALLVEEA